jgi:hypothetical protein
MLTLRAIATKEEKKKLKAETMRIQIETFDRRDAAMVMQQEKRINFLVDDLGLSRDNAIRG